MAERLVLSLPQKANLKEAGLGRFFFMGAYFLMSLAPISLFYGAPPFLGLILAATIFLGVLFFRNPFCQQEAFVGLLKCVFWVFVIGGILMFQEQAGNWAVVDTVGNRVWFVLLLTQPPVAIYDTLQLIKGRATLSFNIKGR